MKVSIKRSGDKKWHFFDEIVTYEGEELRRFETILAEAVPKWAEKDPEYWKGMLLKIETVDHIMVFKWTGAACELVFVR